MKPPTVPQDLLMLILDTTSSRLSLALARGTQVLAEWGITAARPGTSHVLKDIDYLLQRSEVRPTDLTALGVLVGPGSFTGLRVGLAMVQGFGQALGLPVVTATTLEVLAHALAASVGAAHIFVIQSAYREEVYAQIFHRTDGNLIPLTPPQAGSGNDLIPKLLQRLDEAAPPPTRLIFTGDAVAALVSLLQMEAAQRQLTLSVSAYGGGQSPSTNGWQCAASPVFLAQSAVALLNMRWHEGLATDAKGIQPCYARPSEAEIKKMNCEL